MVEKQFRELRIVDLLELTSYLEPETHQQTILYIVGIENTRIT